MADAWEVHNELIKPALELILKGPLSQGVSNTDICLIIESVMTGLLLGALVNSPSPDAVMDLMFSRIRLRYHEAVSEGVHEISSPVESTSH